MNQPKPAAERLEILIDLEQGDSAKALLENELVQRRHYKLLREQIATHLAYLRSIKLRSIKQEEQPYGNGWTQFIDGCRGAGKSTFLSSVKVALEADAELKCQMAFIGLVDPSRIEHCEIILLIILQHLGKRVDAALEKHRQLKDDPLHEEWRRAFKGVAGGLSLFAKDYHPLNDLDPELFLDWGLERASDSTSLRAKLHHLFETACSILGVHGLMLGFDDADTDSTHAIKLLECIRKYLDTPRVMVLVTGHMELYSFLVRQHFAETVAGQRRAAIDLERSLKLGEPRSQYFGMIDNLEEQYLLKLFPIRRRMQLQPLWTVQLRDNYQVTHSTWEVDSIPVKEVVQTIVRCGLRIKTASDVALFTEFLLRQPLRAVLQVMINCAPHLQGLRSTPSNLANGSFELTNALSHSLRALASNSFYKFSIDTDAIAARELSALTQAIFDLSLGDGDLDTAPYLRPMSAEPDIKVCFSALAAEVPNFCANQPGTALRYLLRGPGSVSLYALARAHLSEKDSSPSLDRVHQFKSYMGIGRREDSLDWARRATAVIALPYSGSYKPRVVLPGVIGLRRKRRSEEDLTAWTAIKNAAASQTIQHFPVFALSMVDVMSGTSSRTYSSIFTLIGLIEKLLSADSDDMQEARTIFERAYPLLTVSGPSWSGRAGDDADDQDEAGESDQTKQEALWETVKIWLDSVHDCSERISPSGIFLGKVWTRLFFSLQNAADELKPSANFATMMEIFALCVINAFLVEEAEHHLLRSSNASPATFSAVDRTNPRTSADWFVKKLNKVKPKREAFPLTSIMATCPLLLGLLDGGFAQALKPLFPAKMSEQEINKLLCPNDLKELMQKVSITGGPENQSKTKADSKGGGNKDTSSK